MFYSPIFGICFQLPIICAEERIHITKSKEPDSTGDLLNLDSDAEHQSEKSEPSSIAKQNFKLLATCKSCLQDKNPTLRHFNMP